MNIKIPQEVILILKKLNTNKFESYIVGGAVRDLIMGKLAYDWDITTNATPEEIQKLFSDSYYDNSFGTVGIPAKDKDLKPIEITTFRTEEGYSDSRRPDKVTWGKSLSEDMERRDFTINAMALGLGSEQNKSIALTTWEKTTPNEFIKNDPPLILIDPYKGASDIKKKKIKAVGDPNERFSEDALRMMRAIRIASELNFGIDPKTKDAIKANSYLINKIARERVRDELFKTLKSNNPYEGLSLLKETNLMQEILPEMEKTFGVDQKSPARHHIYDVGTHSMYALKEVAKINKDPITRFATLIHDIGKPQTFKVTEQGIITFYNHEIASAKIASRIAERLRFSNKQKDKLVKLVRYHQFTLNENQTDTALRRFIRNVTPEYLNDMIDLRIGDRLGSGSRETSWRFEDFKKRLTEVQKQPFTVHDLKITGNDVMQQHNLQPGPKIGEILNNLFEKIEKGELKNNKKELMEEIKNIS